MSRTSPAYRLVPDAPSAGFVLHDRGAVVRVDLEVCCGINPAVHDVVSVSVDFDRDVLVGDLSCVVEEGGVLDGLHFLDRLVVSIPFTLP